MNCSANNQNKTTEKNKLSNEPNIYLFYTCNLTCDEELNFTILFFLTYLFPLLGVGY